MMDEYLLIKYHEENCSTQEREQVETWLKKSQENQLTFRQLVQVWEKSAEAAVLEQVDMHADWENIRSRAQAGTATVVPLRQRLFTHRRMFIAASIVLLMTLVGLGYIFLVQPRQQVLIAQNDLSAPLSITLPDGSEVILNQYSTLKYPREMNQEERVVELVGEGFFDVQSHPDQPFIIQTEYATTQVLGTRFNLRAYPTETRVELQVEEGKVQLGSRSVPSQQQIILEKQAATLDIQNNTVTKIDNWNPNALAWKTGMLQFENAPIEEVLQAISDHFGTELILPSSIQTAGCTVYHQFELESLENAMEELQIMVPLTYKWDSDSLVIESINCNPE